MPAPAAEPAALPRTDQRVTAASVRACFGKGLRTWTASPTPVDGVSDAASRGRPASARRGLGGKPVTLRDAAEAAGVPLSCVCLAGGSQLPGPASGRTGARRSLVVGPVHLSRCRLSSQAPVGGPAGARPSSPPAGAARPVQTRAAAQRAPGTCLDVGCFAAFPDAARAPDAVRGPAVIRRQLGDGVIQQARGFSGLIALSVPPAIIPPCSTTPWWRNPVGTTRSTT